MILFMFFELDYFFFGLFFFFVFFCFMMKVFFVEFTSKLNLVGYFLLVLFLSIFFGNYLSMIPFTFVYSSQIYFCLFMSLVYFFGFSFFPKVYNLKSFFSHFCPESIPLSMSPFLIVIEVVSFFMRPIALFLRLFANITAGHVLLGIFIGILPIYLSWLVFPLLLLELMVCSIQSYIFSLLILLWFNE